MNAPITTVRRRWNQFGLRSLFVIITIAAVALVARGWYRPGWIKDRHAFLEHEVLKEEDMAPHLRSPSFRPLSTPTATPGERMALWFLGEERRAKVQVRVLMKGSIDQDLANRPEVRRARELFPEATVEIQTVPVIVPYLGPSWGLK
jgi:hypothetical protein